MKVLRYEVVVKLSYVIFNTTFRAHTGVELLYFRFPLADSSYGIPIFYIFISPIGNP